MDVETWQCKICLKNFEIERRGKYVISYRCAVSHPQGTCCHYGDREVKHDVRLQVEGS